MAVLIFGEYTRRVRVHGAVVPSAGVLHVFAPQTGRLLQAFAPDAAATVAAGDPLFLLGTDTTTNLGETESVVKDQLQSRIDEIAEAIRQRIKLDGVEKRALAERRGAVKREIERVDAQIAQTDVYIAVLQPRAEKYRQLVDKGIILERSFEVAEQSYMQNRQELESLRRQRVQLEGTAAEIRSRLDGFDSSAAIALGELRQRIATLKEQLAQAEARRAIVVAAPANGTVAAVLAHSGQLVATGTPLISLLPTGEKMEIHLLADSKAIGFIREGAHVLLRYTAFPYQKFGQYGGRVTKVSHVTLRPTETDADALAAQPQPSQAQYRITVQPDQPNVMAYGIAEPLRAGMGVEADLLLDTRPLYQWLLEPLYSLRGRVIEKTGENPK
ncbi:HlyD family efflux transporter periplasmic adaptor subunit [Ochrobactrum sp. CM-21-5]|nr:HlyD family efflux transporter periplasmic adaptor subunit [Ochrobactrum sp. CM-21-5]